MRILLFILMYTMGTAQAAAPSQQQLDQISNNTLNSSQGNPETSPDAQPSSYTGVIDSAGIISATLSADPMSCMKWSPVGACVWMTCTPVGCSTSTSVKVYNYVPDLVIQSYDRAEGEPWTESQDINKTIQADSESGIVRDLIGMITGDANDTPIGGGQGTEGKGASKDYRSIKFKLVDSYGSPGAAQYMAMNSTGYMCKGTTTAFMPYLISNLDVLAWRWHIPEMLYPQSLLGFGLSDLRTTLSNNYGGYYPRGGFLYQQNTYKSAVLTAFRSAHVTTRDGQPHVYVPMGGKQVSGYWPPPPLENNDADTGLFQMLYPDEQQNCKTWPQGEPTEAEQSDDGSYVWNFWRPYKCCERRGSNLVWHSG